MTIKNIPIGQIDDNPAQTILRPSYSINKVNEFAYSFTQVGMRNIPEARLKDGRYQLAHGHCRKRAFLKLIKNTPKNFPHKATLALVKEGVMPLNIESFTDQEMIQIAIEENLRRSDTTTMSVARGIELFVNTFKGETVTSAATKFNMSQGAVSNMLRVLRCPEDILEKIDTGKINFTMARELLIFQGKSAKGMDQGRWDRKSQGYKKVEKNDTWLMLEAIKGIGGSYGPPATVDGIKKSIFNVARDNFPALEKGGSSYYHHDFEPLFDTRAAGCLKCEHAITCYETKTQTRHYCTNEECWGKKQEAHKKKQAAEAKKLADLAVKKQVEEMEKARQEAAKTPPKPIPQEIPAPPPEEAAAETTVPEKPQTPTPDFVGDEAAVTQSEAPSNIKAAAKNQAGTRSQVLDIRDLRSGNYGDLKHGYILLNSGFRAPLECMEDPKECTERCTKGFHYAYDSASTDGKVLCVCSDPKCVTKKKTAFTRAKNAEGQSRKKAELTAIRDAVDKTTVIDKPRMLLILEAEMLGRHVRSYSYTRNDTKEVLMKLLGIEKKEQYEQEAETVKRIREALVKKTDAELAKVIVEFMLRMFIYDGEVQEYKINTAAYLKLMGVEVNLERKDGEEATADKFRGRTEQTVRG